jgi:hypothetical protein
MCTSSQCLDLATYRGAYPVVGLADIRNSGEISRHDIDRFRLLNNVIPYVVGVGCIAYVSRLVYPAVELHVGSVQRH